MTLIIADLAYSLLSWNEFKCSSFRKHFRLEDEAKTMYVISAPLRTEWIGNSRAPSGPNGMSVAEGRRGRAPLARSDDLLLSMTRTAISVSHLYGRALECSQAAWCP